jgi:hypothetical protein
LAEVTATCGRVSIDATRCETTYATTVPAALDRGYALTPTEQPPPPPTRGRSFALAFYAFPELLSARIGGIRRFRVFWAVKREPRLSLAPQ